MQMQTKLNSIKERQEAASKAFKQEMEIILEELQVVKISVDQKLEQLPEEPEDRDDPYAEQREQLTDLSLNLDLLIDEVDSFESCDTADFSAVLTYTS